MDRVWCLILTTILLSNCIAQAAGGPRTTTALQCLHTSSKKCTIPMVQHSEPSDELMLPDLSDKTTLQIKGGSLTTLDGQLCEKLGTVRKLQVGQLGLKQLCLLPQLWEVSAADNAIELITFKPVSAVYKLEKLDLRNNSLSTLHGFDVLVNLVEVHLENNALESFEWNVFKNMSKLEKLFLNGNKLKNVVASEEINLPALDYLSLAENQLTSLDVTKWELESLTEFDLSHNSLSVVYDLSQKFPSSQVVHLANNQWYCKWLQDTLEHFNRTYVTIKDRDEHCEGITSANICCTPESDILPEDSELQSKLDKLEGDQKTMRSNLESDFTSLKSKNDDELTDLEKQLMLLVVPSTVEPGNSNTTASSSWYKLHEEKLQEVQRMAEKALRQVSLQKGENERAHLRLSYNVLELRKSIERSKKTVAGLQAQFNKMRSDIYAAVKKRE